MGGRETSSPFRDGILYGSLQGTGREKEREGERRRVKGKEGRTNEGGRKGREGEGEKMRKKKRERSRGRQLHTAERKTSHVQVSCETQALRQGGIEKRRVEGKGN